MLKNWQAEKKSLVMNNHVLRVALMRKKLKDKWLQVGRPNEEISSVDRMRKAEVSKHLYFYYHVMAVKEQQIIKQ
jgi:hypothetical protein